LQLRLIRIYDDRMNFANNAMPHPEGGADAPPISPAAAAGGAAGNVRRLDSRTLLGRDREVVIEHADQVYRLRLTTLGKLILTK
jgi:hemin uptake protein HemP